jgi:hypothetical protein
MIFIPPQLAEHVVKPAEIFQLRDMFGHLRQKEGKYTPGQIHARWSDEIEWDFSQWLKMNVDKLPVPKEQMQELLKERVSQINCGPGVRVALRGSRSAHLTGRCPAQGRVLFACFRHRHPAP